MNASGTALQGKHTVEASELYMAFELGEKNWKLVAGRRGAQPEPLYGGGRGHYGVARVYRQGQGALWACAGGEREQLL